MKSLIIGILLTFFLTQISSAQWYIQNPIPGNTFSANKIQFFDESNGIIVGSLGLVYLTTNGGYTWGSVYIGESENFVDMSFINRYFGIILSENSILKTSDGGWTWDKILEVENNNHLRYCSIGDTLNFFVTMSVWGPEYQTYILTSNDGGISWNQSPVFTGIPYDIYFMNKNVGFYFLGNKLYKTIDGGINWTITQFPDMSSLNISFCDSLNGMVMGSHTFLTNNGGLSWHQANYPPEGVRDAIEYAPDLIVAVGSNQSIYKSTDQGNTWMQLLYLGGGSSSEFTAVSVVDSFYYVSGSRKIYKSSNSGGSWFSIKQGTTEKLYSIDMVNRDFGIAVGGNGVVVTTHNGGATWEIQNSGTDEYLYSIDCIDTLNALAAGYHGTIIKTTDGGENWITINSGVSISLYHLGMLDQNIGMAVGSAGTILRTIDGGNSWQSEIISDIGFWVSNYLDSANIFLGGSFGNPYGNSYGCILRSQNAGLTWDTVYQVLFKYPHSICSLGDHFLLVSGSDGLLVKSTDMGSTWVSLNAPSQYHFFTSFIDSSNGLLCSMDGLIYRTTNGGNSWVGEWPYYSDLQDIQMLNIEDAVAVGSGGNIMSTITNHIMPVELKYFSGYSEFGKVYLNWETGSELNNLMFEVERKITANGNDGGWIKIGYRKGRGTTTEITKYTFVDDIQILNTFLVQYRLKQIDYNGDVSYSDIINVKTSSVDYQLLQNYPNPFNPVTKIRYSIPELTRVQIKVFDVLGAEIATLVNKEKPAGHYELNWNAGNLPSGVYFYQLRAGDFIQTRKLILLK